MHEDSKNKRGDLCGQTSVKPIMTYGSYLKLKTLYKAQAPVSTAHDEMLFITIHHVSELWISLILHEIQAALPMLRQGTLRPVFKVLSRVKKIQKQLVNVWDLVSTLTTNEYLNFRDQLGQSSGFQSDRYRMLEFALGNKRAILAEVFVNDEEIYSKVIETLERPSVYDEVLMLLRDRGFDIPDELIDRDWSSPYEPHHMVEAAWKSIYQDVDRYWDLYELAESLLDIEYLFQIWRFSHYKSVERLIGDRFGTGGTEGVSYLVKALDLKFFPELQSIKSKL
jgi:tryptophan 2,3-dioxygenase